MITSNEISFFEFKNRFDNEDACHEYLFKVRWPNGYICPKCDNKSFYYINKRNLYQCCSCRYQTSVTVGTVLEKTHISLEKWFWAIYLVSTDKRGYSAMALHRELQISYKTAWYLLHRIRTAMFDRELDYILSGFVEIDDAYIGSVDEGGKRGRGTDKTKIVVGISLDDKKRPQFLKIEVVDNLDSDVINGFAGFNIKSGSTISTDAYTIYNQLNSEGYDHRPKIFNQKVDKEHLKWVHTIVSNAKALVNGTHHGLDKKHLQLYLSEFCFRFNRRFYPKNIFNRLIFNYVNSEKIAYAELTT